MALSAGGGRRVWVVDVEKKLDEADASVEVSRWQRHCIYRVPACIKDLKPKAYRPQVVSLGPFHHGDPELVPMEEHKRRALRHLLRRAKRPLEEFVAAVEEIADQVASAYLDLGAEWRDGDGRERFLEMMIVDGCFLLEVMRAASLDAVGKSNTVDYAPNDPIFSHHGVLYMVPYIRRDMLMLENQLPLLLLERLVAVETGKPTVIKLLRSMLISFPTPCVDMIRFMKTWKPNKAKGNARSCSTMASDLDFSTFHVVSHLGTELELTKAS
jgi:hypothetical protein